MLNIVNNINKHILYKLHLTHIRLSLQAYNLYIQRMCELTYNVFFPEQRIRIVNVCVGLRIFALFLLCFILTIENTKSTWSSKCIIPIINGYVTKQVQDDAHVCTQTAFLNVCNVWTLMCACTLLVSATLPLRFVIRI